MVILATSPVIEDRYIAHLAGLKNDTKLLKQFAHSEPICNASRLMRSVFTVTKNLVGTVSTVTLGVMSYPLLNSELRESIFGHFGNVYSSCETYSKSLHDLFTTLSKIGIPVDSWRAALEIGSERSIFYSDGKCRAINYIGGVYDTFSNNLLLIGIATVGLYSFYEYLNQPTLLEKSQIAFYEFLNNKSNLQKEKKQENDFAKQFDKIPARLLSLEANPEIQECAKGIIQRQVEINTEIENLRPNMNLKDIKQITQPIFDAAKQITQKKESQS